MVKHTTRRQKMRGGGKGVLIVSWTVSGKPKSDFFDFITDEEEYYEEDLLSNIYLAVEAHVASAGYKKAELFKTLEEVDVEFDGDDGPVVPEMKLNLPVPDGTIDIGAKFELKIVGGKRGKRGAKKTRGRRH